MNRVIIAGGRGFKDMDILRKYCNKILIDAEHVEIVSGTARGADTLGEQYAKEKEYAIKLFPADWITHGHRAGHVRNDAMAKYADTLIAFWDGKSKGTKNMITNATKRGLHTYVYHYLPTKLSTEGKEQMRSIINLCISIYTQALEMAEGYTKDYDLYISELEEHLPYFEAVYFHGVCRLYETVLKDLDKNLHHLYSPFISRLKATWNTMYYEKQIGYTYLTSEYLTTTLAQAKSNPHSLALAKAGIELRLQLLNRILWHM